MLCCIVRLPSQFDDDVVDMSDVSNLSAHSHTLHCLFL